MRFGAEHLDLRIPFPHWLQDPRRVSYVLQKFKCLAYKYGEGKCFSIGVAARNEREGDLGEWAGTGRVPWASDSSLRRLTSSSPGAACSALTERLPRARHLPSHRGLPVLIWNAKSFYIRREIAMNYSSTKIQVGSQLCTNKKYTAQFFQRNDAI